MARARPSLALRPYLAADAVLLAEIFRASIEELTADDYSQNQRDAWASLADDEAAFAQRLAGELTLIATLEGAPVGFAALKGVDAVDMLYVHPAASGQGAASMLIDALEKLAAARGATHLTVEASDSAEDFFRNRGYEPMQRNSISVGGEWLANTSMKKPLAGGQGAS